MVNDLVVILSALASVVTIITAIVVSFRALKRDIDTRLERIEIKMDKHDARIDHLYHFVATAFHTKSKK